MLRYLLPSVALLFVASSIHHLSAAESAEFKVTGDWEVTVHVPAETNRKAVDAKLTVVPPPTITVEAEKVDQLPVYNAAGPQYLKGARLKGIRAEGLTAPDLLDPESVEVRLSADKSAELLERGNDFEFETRWGGIGRLEGGKIPADVPVYVSYRYVQQRIDSIVLTPAGKIEIREGKGAPTVAQQPELQAGEIRLANLWFPKKTTQLSQNQVFPILETEYPVPPQTKPTPVEQFAPKTWAKIQAGKPVKILAWGDSVTDGSYLADPATEHWQAQFVAQLKERFPQAQIELVTEAWGGRTTDAYLGVPPGQPHNFQEKVLAVQPDLIVSEFVNDAFMKPDVVETKYSKLLADFQGIGAEWIILTPHYVRPDWMGLDREREIDADPRPYVQGLREFAKNHNVALADASLRYGRLWRQGIPYNSLMVNCINHPDPRGMKIFADALLELFPEK